jgi:hypothetical protein
MRRWALRAGGGVLVAVLVLFGILWSGWPLPPSVQRWLAPVAAVLPSSDPATRPAFDRWLAAAPGRRADFAAFAAFLHRSGVADIVPPWTLLRADGTSSRRCLAAAFVMPPRRLWPNILPALRLVRARVIPAVGQVEVSSALRDPALNACANGAQQSRHLSFSALDLLPVEQADKHRSFALLCRAWRRAGGGSGWGLGAYYDPARPLQNRVGRFHVDGTGWRTWGFSYRRASSGCNIV